jgi:tetratricopeptide (TPR) repeat protein
MKAAGQNGIPCAFVVGKDGFIEWIGHPMSIDRPLANIIEGNWDRDAFAVEYEQGQEIKRKSTEIINLAQTGRFEKALAIANELLEDSSTQNGKQQVESLIRLVRSREVAMHILKNSDEAPARMEALLEGRPSSEVNNFIWQDIVLVKEKGRKIGDKVLATASRLTEKAVQATPEDFYLLDTYARLLNIQGQLDKAIEVQEKAVKFTGEKERKSVEDFLQTLRQLKNPSITKKSDAVSRKSSDMLGVWVNTDPDTGGITKIAIYEKDGATLIRAFGSCSPKDCDLGSTEFHALGDTARSMEFPYGFATWNSGFAVYYFTLKLDNDKISVTNSTIFKDKSRRTNYRSDFTFRKAEGDEATLPPEKAIKNNRNVVGQE